MSETLCALVIERKGMKPLVIASDSPYQLSKFKDKLDQRISESSITATEIVGIMMLDDFMAIEEIIMESKPERRALMTPDNLP